MIARFLALVLMVSLAGCEEELTVPGRCPELCPGGQPAVFDTIIPAVDASDTSFFGYSGHSGITSLLVSNEIEAGQARSWVRFPERPDSVTVSAVRHPYTVDSVAFSFTLVARDTLVDDLKIFLHKAPLTFDSLTSFQDVEAVLVPETLIDSLEVPDSVRTGQIRVVITDSATLANLIQPADTGRLALALRIGAEAATGIRVSAIAGGGGGASFITYARIDVPDTTQQRQTLSLNAADNGFALEQTGEPLDPDLLYVGRVPSSRTFVRFPIPGFFNDSALQLVRVTLELTPAEPVTGLRGDPGILDVRGVIKDIGAKSTPFFQANGSTSLPISSSDPVQVEILGVVELWRLGESGLAPTLILAMAPDGGSFHRPVFHSTRTAQGPRLRITYVLPSQVERP